MSSLPVPLVPTAIPVTTDTVLGVHSGVVNRFLISDVISTAVKTSSLSSTTGATLVGTSSGFSVQTVLDSKSPIASPTFTGTVTIPAGASIAGFALLASPTFTGVPAAPTATAGTNTTQLATTSFVRTAVSGVSSIYAPIASPTFTGSVTLPAGTTSAPFEKLTPGSLLTTTTSNSWEYDGVNLFLTNNAATRVQIPPSSQLGQCQLVLSGGNLVLNRLDGSYIFINSVFRPIPSSGPTLAATGLTPGTLYYIYASWNGTSVILTADTTAPTIDTNTGQKIKSGTGGGLFACVGMASPVTGPAWVDTSAQRFVLSWYNKKSKDLNSALITDVSVSNSTFVTVSGLSVMYLKWSNETVRATISGFAQAPIGRLLYLATSIDGSNVASDSGTIIQQASATAAVNYSFTLPYENSSISEGLHTHGMCALIDVASGSGIIHGAGSPGTGRTTITGATQG